MSLRESVRKPVLWTKKRPSTSPQTPQICPEVPKVHQNPDASLSIEQASWQELARNARFSPKRLAKSANISLRHLQRIFRKFFQRSPKACLEPWRLLCAQEGLSSRKTIKVVAEEVGFRHVSNFSQWFKRELRTTPARFVKTAL